MKLISLIVLSLLLQSVCHAQEVKSSFKFEKPDLSLVQMKEYTNTYLPA